MADFTTSPSSWTANSLAQSDARRDRLIEHALGWMVTLSVVGYPLAGVMSVILGVESRVTSIPYRLVVDALSVLVVLLIARTRTGSRLDPLLIVFMWMYLVRLVWDLQRPEFETAVTDTLFFISTMLIPSVAAGVAARYWNDGLVARQTLILGGVICVLTLYVDMSGLAGDRSLTQAQGRLRLDTVNPITFGQLAVSVLFAVFVLWTRQRTLIWRVGMLATSGIAVAVLVLANSRSPFVAVILASLAWLVATRRWRLLMLGAVAAVAVIFGADIADRLADSRLVTVTDRSAQERLIVQAQAWQDFLGSPLLGSGYLDSVSFFYPHNILLESLMAMGVLGGVLLSAILIQAVFRNQRALTTREWMLAFFFWQYLVLAMLSGSLYSSGVLFMVIMVLSAHYGAARATLPLDPMHPARS